MSKRVLVCLSGGVDSTVAAFLLKEQGADVEGITFWFWSFPGAPKTAANARVSFLDAARRAAADVGIPHRTVDASKAFYHRVLEDFVSRYRRGETPNPCARCNRLLRFDLAFEEARRGGFEAVATGHHARIIERVQGQLELHRGVDPAKDQSYFLYGLKEPDLVRLEFPVGELPKDEVALLAQEREFYAASLPESQDLCFALAGETDFLFSPEDFTPGPILDLDGNRLGEHEGLPRYTIGQRRGLRIPAGRPLYVIAIDYAGNAVIVGEEEDLYSDSLVAEEASFISEAMPSDSAKLKAKIRYRSPAVPCSFRPLSEERFSVAFEKPQRAITPGQIVALYDGDRLLGGGTIVGVGHGKGGV